MKKKDYLYEFKIHLSSREQSGGELLRYTLTNYGIDLSEMVEKREHGETVLSFFGKATKEFDPIRSVLKKLKIRDVECVRLENRDWRDVWKESYQPFALTENIHVVPIAYQDSYKSEGKIHLSLDTSVAFGTGLHETTQFMADLIERSKNEINSFLDIGTGTGILALVAFYNGAQKIQAIDLDPECIKIASENFKRNKAQGIRLMKGDIAHFKGQSFDFVAANLVTEDLIKFRQQILNLVSKNGLLAVSGISKDNFPRFKKMFIKGQIKLVQLLSGKEWMACLLRKN